MWTMNKAKRFNTSQNMNGTKNNNPFQNKPKSSKSTQIEFITSPSSSKNDSILASELSKLSIRLGNIIKSSQSQQFCCRTQLLLDLCKTNRLHPDSSLNSENELLHSQHVGALSELQNQFETLIQLEKDGNFVNLEENKAKIEADFERMKTEIEFVVEKRILEDVQNLVKTDLSCSICSEIFDKPMVLNCGHSFCTKCIKTWTKQLNARKECPLCRKLITSCEKHIDLEKFVSNFKSFLKDEKTVLQKLTTPCETKLKMDPSPGSSRSKSASCLVMEECPHCPDGGFV